MNMPSLKERTAYHEAGHAVAFFLTGRRIARIRLGEAKGAGQCDPIPIGKNLYDLLDGDRGMVENHVVVLLAGAVAEVLFVYGLEEGALEGVEYEGEDTQEARVVLSLLYREPSEFTEGTDLACGHYWWRAVDLLREPSHWRAIQALARALLKHASIEGEDAHRIIDNALRRRTSHKAVEDLGTPLPPQGGLPTPRTRGRSASQNPVPSHPIPRKETSSDGR
jgi:hypothetical protein